MFTAQSFINMKYTLRKIEGPLAVPEHKLGTPRLLENAERFQVFIELCAD